MQPVVNIQSESCPSVSLSLVYLFPFSVRGASSDSGSVCSVSLLWFPSVFLPFPQSVFVFVSFLPSWVYFVLRFFLVSLWFCGVRRLPFPSLSFLCRCVAACGLSCACCRGVASFGLSCTRFLFLSSLSSLFHLRVVVAEFSASLVRGVWCEAVQVVVCSRCGIYCW